MLKLFPVILMLVARTAALSTSRLDSIVDVYSDGSNSKLNEYYYNESGDLVEYRVEYTSKCEYYYYESGDQKIQVCFGWNAKIYDWENTSKYEYFYDESGNQKNVFISFWDVTNQNWRNGFKYEYRYDEYGCQIEWFTYFWSIISQDWKNSSKYEYFYDVYGNQIAMFSYSWNTTNQNWENSSKHEYSYDAYGNKIEYRYYPWDITAKDWKNAGKTEIHYNEYGKVEKIFSYNYKEEFFEWDLYCVSYYYYTFFPASVAKAVSGSVDIKLLTSPAAESFQVLGIHKTELLRLSDASGRVLLSREINLGENIGITHLSSGIYWVCVQGKTLRLQKR